MRLLAIDPGPDESAYVVYDTATRLPTSWDKVVSEEVLARLDVIVADTCAIEMVASYGMPVGAEVFDTCVWVGRYTERWRLSHDWRYRCEPRLVYRREVKLHLCQDSRAKDANIRQAIIDRYGGKAQAIGLKATPGPLYGMSGDVWQAFGVALTATETPA